MGHKLSQPKKPGCIERSNFFGKERACTFVDRPPVYQDDEGVENDYQDLHTRPSHRSPHVRPHPHDGATLIRLTVGSHETIAMGGSMPGLAVFDEFGARVGQTTSTLNRTAPGGFKDVMIRHSKERGNGRPSYLLVQGGEEAICITSIALTYPDGTSQLVTGDDLAKCDRLTTDQSRSFVGAGYDQPRCFWLQDSKVATKGYQRLSFHLPDLVWTSSRIDAYQKNPELLCKDTPRFWSWGPESRGDDQAIMYPIAIFNPLLEYDPITNFDKDPDRVLKWQWDGTMNDFSDRPFEPQKSVTRRGARPGRIAASSKMNVAIESMKEDMVPFEGGRVEEERVRTQAPTLVVSDGAISAQDQCLHGTWNHTDYLSLSEKIYCDMQSQTMFWMCDAMMTNCFDPETGRLQEVKTHENHQNLNLLASSSSWAATGPLFGFAYPNVTFIG